MIESGFIDIDGQAFPPEVIEPLSEVSGSTCLCAMVRLQGRRLFLKRLRAFRLNVGAPVWLDGRNMIVIHKMAQTINAALGGSGMTAYDAKYLSSRHYGWRDYCPSMNP